MPDQNWIFIWNLRVLQDDDGICEVNGDLAEREILQKRLFSFEGLDC